MDNLFKFSKFPFAPLYSFVLFPGADRRGYPELFSEAASDALVQETVQTSELASVWLSIMATP